jgi:hypothetical protein
MSDVTKRFPSLPSKPANHGWLCLHLLLVLLFLAVQGGSVAMAEPVTTINIAKKIAEAKTPADHKAIAAYYRSQAAEADAKIKVHEKMKQAYRSVDKSAYSDRWHRWYCDSLINSSRTAKDAYEALAEEHEEAAE